MDSSPDQAPPRTPSPSAVPVELIGEGLLLASLVLAPWVYGSVEDSVRYALCAVVLLASTLFLWPDLGEGGLARGLGIALALPALAFAQTVLGQSVAPVMTLETAAVAFAMAMVWASIDARAGSASTNSGRRLAWAMLLLCVSESGFAAYQWSTDRTALFGEKGGLQTMPFGSYVNHNNFAGLVAMGVPLAIALAIGDLRRSGQLTAEGLGLMGVACGLAIAVFASGSRGGVVALICGLVVLAFLSARKGRREPTEHRRPWLGAVVVAGAILAIALFAVPASTRGRIVGLFEASGSTSYRVDMATASARAFLHRPWLGSGLGAFGDAVTPFKTGHGEVRSERAEADLIEFVVEGGLVLVVGLTLFGRFAWRSARREMEQGRGRSGRWLRAGALASCATMLFHSAFDFGFRIPANALAFAVLLGLATASSQESRGGRPFVGRLFAAFVALAVAGCVYRSVGAAQEQAALSRASAESRLDALEVLVEAHPYLDSARRQRGLSWLTLAYSRGGYDASRLERAVKDLQRVVNSRPQWGLARADLGWAYFYQARYQEAVKEMRAASRLDPTHMGVGIAYAQVLAWSGNPREAVAEIARLRRINPGWPQASARELVSSWTTDRTLIANVP